MTDPQNNNNRPTLANTIDANGDGRLQSSEFREGAYQFADSMLVLSDLMPENREGEKARLDTAREMERYNVDDIHQAWGQSFPNGAEPLTAEDRAAAQQGFVSTAATIRTLDHTTGGDLTRMTNAVAPSLSALVADTNEDREVSREEHRAFKQTMEGQGIDSSALPNRDAMNNAFRQADTGQEVQIPERQSVLQAGLESGNIQYLSADMQAALAQSRSALSSHNTLGSMEYQSHENAQNPQASTARDAAAVLAAKAQEGGIQ